MTLHKMLLPDFEEVVDMYYEFMAEVYPDRQIGERYFFYQVVAKWINDSKNVILVKKGNETVGFSMCYINGNSGLTEPVYLCEVAYIKPEYRNTRAAYILYKNSSDFARENNLTITGNAMLTTDGSKIIDKHFHSKKMFINYERNKNEY